MEQNNFFLQIQKKISNYRLSQSRNVNLLSICCQNIILTSVAYSGAIFVCAATYSSLQYVKVSDSTDPYSFRDVKRHLGPRGESVPERPAARVTWVRSTRSSSRNTRRIEISFGTYILHICSFHFM